jgi:hypothetical protein
LQEVTKSQLLLDSLVLRHRSRGSRISTTITTPEMVSFPRSLGQDDKQRKRRVEEDQCISGFGGRVGIALHFSLSLSEHCISEYLKGDIAERDRLLDYFCTQLGFCQSENLALHREIAALKNALLNLKVVVSIPVSSQTFSGSLYLHVMSSPTPTIATFPPNSEAFDPWMGTSVCMQGLPSASQS